MHLNHVEVVALLKELPVSVEMVCARKIAGVKITASESTEAQEQTALSPNASSSENPPSGDRLVKAKSDGSLAVVSSSTDSTKTRSRSLEPLNGLAMWNSEPQVIELVKGERGLGFSILDYQDPMNPCETVIVIRSLVPGGVAQQDGRLIPGDRLVFVNDVNLENASLDVAVQGKCSVAEVVTRNLNDISVAVLKGAPKGVVRIGVAKPLPLPDSNSHQVSEPSDNARGQPSSQQQSHYVCHDGIAMISHALPPQQFRSSGSSVLGQRAPTIFTLDSDQF